MELADHFQAIWRNRWWILAGTVLVTAVVVGLRLAEDESYEADARLTMEVPAVGTQVGKAEDLAFLARTYTARARTVPVLREAALNAGLDLSPGKVRTRTSATVSPDDATIRIIGRGPTGTEAAALATGMAEALATYVDNAEELAREQLLAPLDARLAAVDRTLADSPPGSPAYESAAREYAALRASRTQVELTPTVGLEVLEAADEPSEPVSPRPLRDGLLAFLVALVVLAELAALKELYNQRWGALGPLR